MNRTICSFLLLLIPLKSFTQTGVDKPIYEITTYRDSNLLGTFTMELFPLIAPLHVANFDSLVSQNFYDSTAFHRVVPGFVIQGGDPNSISGPISTWGQGQPWQPTVPAEFNAVRHLRGIVGAARDTDPNSANSQFYICVAPATFLDGNYTVYGKVTQGMSVVDTIVLSPRDVNDVPLQKISMFIDYIGVNDTIPDPVTLTDPPNQSVNITSSQVFKWTTVPGAVLYTAEFATDSLFSNIVLTKSAGINQLIANTLPGSATYYWRVRSNNGGHESINSTVWKFSTVTAAANLINPADSSTGVLLNPVFEWNAVPLASSYQLQVATAVTFSSFSLVYNQSGITDTSQQIPPLNPNTRYYWRVRSFNGSTGGNFSAKYTFETGTQTGLINTAAWQNGIEIYPNPASDYIIIKNHTGLTGNSRFSIFDVTGRCLLSEQLYYNEDGSYRISTNGLPRGTYMLKLNNPAAPDTTELLIIQ